ncbi:hypothetical protein VKT23_019416 [Stygiomarasmius scandens]|uniref:Uncharacterized protein n=1 Tax=Marasmiellus scandens TaxID=2682957 RepID=A0ABR1ILK1_9AGAR
MSTSVQTRVRYHSAQSYRATSLPLSSSTRPPYPRLSSIPTSVLHVSTQEFSTTLSPDSIVSSNPLTPEENSDVAQLTANSHVITVHSSQELSTNLQKILLGDGFARVLIDNHNKELDLVEAIDSFNFRSSVRQVSMGLKSLWFSTS